jgi:hypothetical protein
LRQTGFYTGYSNRYGNFQTEPVYKSAALYRNNKHANTRSVSLATSARAKFWHLSRCGPYTAMRGGVPRDREARVHTPIGSEKFSLCDLLAGLPLTERKSTQGKRIAQASFGHAGFAFVCLTLTLTLQLRSLAHRRSPGFLSRNRIILVLNNAFSPNPFSGYAR